MSDSLNAQSAPPARRRRFKLRPLRDVRDESGTAAIEFAMTAMPFFLFCLAIMGFASYFFIGNILSHSAEISSRSIRTGLAQVGNPNANPVVPPMTNTAFLAAVCSNGIGLLSCDSSHLVVHVQSWANWNQVVPSACTDNTGNLTPPTGASTDLISLYTGGSNQVVLVTVCYKWDLATTVSYLHLPKTLQATTAFRSEPYN